MIALRDRCRSRRAAPALIAVLLLSGCAGHQLSSARTAFYAGRPAEAAQLLAEAKTTGRDRVLVLMERGTMRMAAGDYMGSVADFIQAHDEVERMTAVQVAQGTTSLVVNDTVQDYTGVPFERTLLHAMAAHDHFAVADWEKAAVEARRILNTLEDKARGDYPDVAYARYLAGFCLQMMDDESNAALQFRKAAALVPGLAIDDRTGRIGPASAASGPAELVCFIFIGGLHNPAAGSSVSKLEKAAFAEIHHEGQLLGRSHNLSDTVDLAFTTEQKEAAKKLAKTAARVAIKETVSYQIAQDNELLGELVRLILVGILEQPDLRRWETLPRWLQVARVPCPADLTSFDVVFKNHQGVTTRTVSVTEPLARRRNTFVSYCRDLPTTTVVAPAPAPAPAAVDPATR